MLAAHPVFVIIVIATLFFDGFGSLDRIIIAKRGSNETSQIHLLQNCPKLSVELVSAHTYLLGADEGRPLYVRVPHAPKWIKFPCFHLSVARWYATFSFRASECTQAFHTMLVRKPESENSVRERISSFFRSNENDRTWEGVSDWAAQSANHACSRYNERTFLQCVRNIFKIWLRHMWYACALM